MSIKALLITLLAAIGIPVAAVLILFTMKTVSINEKSGELLEIAKQQDALMVELAAKLKDQQESLGAQTDAIKQQYDIERQIAAIEELQISYKLMEVSYLSAIIMRRTKQLDLFAARGKDLREVLAKTKPQLPDLIKDVSKNLDQHMKDIDNAIGLFGKRNKRPAVKLYQEQIIPETRRIKDLLTEERRNLGVARDEYQKNLTLVIDRLATVTNNMHQAKSRVGEQAEILYRSSKNIAAASSNLASLSLLTALTLLIFVPAVGFSIIQKIMKPVLASERSLHDIVSHKDLTIQLPNIPGEIGRILGATASLLNDFRNSFYNVKESSAEFERRADALDTVSQKTCKSLNDQITASDELNKRLESLTNVARHTFDLMSSFGVSVEQSQKVAQEGLTTINDGLSRFQEIIVVVENFQQETTALKQTVESVSGILQSVREISKQTNLLALNAAIESARAGEHGRGFSVVAEEIRNLSTQTENAVGEVDSKLERLHKSVDNTQQVVTSGLEISQEGAIKAQSAGKSIVEIVSGIDAMNAQISELNNYSQQSSDLSIESADLLMKVKAITDDNYQVTESLVVAASQSKTEAQRLADFVRAYRV